MLFKKMIEQRMHGLKTVKTGNVRQKRVVMDRRSPKKRLVRVIFFIALVVAIGLGVKVVVEKVFFSNPLLGQKIL